MYTESGIPVRHFFNSPSHYKNDLRTSLVVQRLIHLPVQGAWVQPLVQEDPTCFGVMKPVGHYYWAQALESMLCSKRSPCSARTLRLERAHMHQWRPSPVKYMNEGTNEWKNLTLTTPGSQSREEWFKFVKLLDLVVQFLLTHSSFLEQRSTAIFHNGPDRRYFSCVSPCHNYSTLPLWRRGVHRQYGNKGCGCSPTKHYFTEIWISCDFHRSQNTISLLNFLNFYLRVLKVAVGLSYMVFIMLRYVPSLLTFSGVSSTYEC